MLLYFKVKNYRSFRDEAILDMEAASLSNHTECLLQYRNGHYLPSAAIFGKNGGGKSNLIRAMWLAVQFICNAQRLQTENASVPVHPFALDNYSSNEPTAFEFAYVLDGVKYVYGFSATRKCIVSEYLKSWPKGREKLVFSRSYQSFTFPKDPEYRRKELIQEAVSPNQLFFAISCTMNYKPCIEAMRWFRECIVFSRDYTDINKNLIEFREDNAMLQAMKTAALAADVGIQDIKFEIDDHEIDLSDSSEDDPKDPQLNEAIQKNFPGLLRALRLFSEAIRQVGNDAEVQLSAGMLKSTTFHTGKNSDGETSLYPMSLSDESDGTRRLMTLAPAIEKTLANGGVFVVDEIDREMHLMLVEHVLNRYQEKSSNPNGAQIVFTTHETALLNQEILRRDQIYFVDKNRDDGASSLYSLAEFNVRKDKNILKSYLVGKFGAIPEIQEEP